MLRQDGATADRSGFCLLSSIAHRTQPFDASVPLSVRRSRTISSHC